MNFRTTILLLMLLVAAAAVFFIGKSRRDGGDADPGRTAKSDGAEKKLMDLATSDVKRVVVTRDTGERLVLERAGTDWRIVEPIKAPAESFKVDDLVREVTDLRSRGQVEPGDKGVDQPQFTVELTHGADDKTTKVKVGNRSPVGDMLYVRLGDDAKADVVSASIFPQLEKQAADYRKARLLSVTNDKINGVTIAYGDKTLKLERAADDKWHVREPKDMPGDDAQVSTLLSAVTGLDAVKFVAEDAKDAASYGLNKPSMVVTFTTEPPATQPSTGPAATTAPSAAANTTTIRFGRADMLKQNVYAMVSDAGPIVTVANTELEGLKKTPLDLRDRQVLDLDANAISRVTLSVDRAATTQPTSQPAEKRELVLERRSEVTEVGPPAPATGPAPAEGSAPPAGEQKEGAAPTSDAPPIGPPPAEPAPAEPAPAAPAAPAPAESNAVEPKPADAQPAPPQPQVRATSPDGGAVVTLAAFQEQPAEPKPTPEAPAAPAAPAEAKAGEEPAKPDAPAPAADDAAKPDAPADAEKTEPAKPDDAAAAAAAEATTAPASAPSTAPTTEPAATQPALPKSKWLIASEPKADANDGHVQSLIGALAPLRAVKYLETFPSTQATPVGTYVLKISTRAWGDEPAKEHEIKITDPGGTAKPIAQVGDLVFEIDRTFLDKLTADFTEPNKPAPTGFPEEPDLGGMPDDLIHQLGGGGGGPPGR